MNGRRCFPLPSRCLFPRCLSLRSPRGSSGGRRCLAGAVLTLLAALPIRAQDPAPTPDTGNQFRPRRPSRETEQGIAIDARTQHAIQMALRFLSLQQNKENGSFLDIVGRKVHNAYEGELNPHVGVTALAGIAFLASGNLPDQGPYGREIRLALDYVLGQVHDNGFISAWGSRMYEHAFATLFLAEAYGTTRDERVKEKLKLAIRLIERSQNQEGGWRYLPGAKDSDMSVTVCQVMALRAARNAGIQVPRNTIDGAIRYVKDSFKPDEGAFDYQILKYPGRSRTSFALTAAGVTTLYGAGEYDAFEIKKGLEYLWKNRPEADHAEQRFDYYYGQYYAVQAMFQAGGSFWSAWYRYIRDDLLRIQHSDGSWRDLVGANYATAMAAIILQMPYQYLPITER